MNLSNKQMFEEYIEALSRRHDLHPTRINAWKKDFLGDSTVIFEK